MRTPALARALLLASLSATVLLGCGDDDDDAATQDTEAVEETSTTEVPDPVQQYLDISTPSNCLSDRINEATGRIAPDGQVSEEGFAAYKAEVLALYGEAADAIDGQAEDLRAATWPADVQDEIDALAASRVELAAYFRDLAAVGSLDELDAFYASHPEPDVSAIAPARAALGLPPTDSPEYQAIDWCAGPPQP